MKTRTTLLALLIFSLNIIHAQYETTFTLYDTISEGPFITPQNGGYNFIFKTKKQGTLVSTRGQVINPSLEYETFNHFYLYPDGKLDSLLSVPIRVDVSQHYTLYKKGMPKIIQFREGTSNDPPLDRIESKYPVLKDSRPNDEDHAINKIVIDNGTYELTKQTYSQGRYNEQKITANIELTAEEGQWKLLHQYSAPNIDQPQTIQVYGLEKNGDKDLKYNHLRELRFIALNENGEITRDEEMTYESAFEIRNSGRIHDERGRCVGYYISMIEAGGKANKDFDPTYQKVLFFDERGHIERETKVNLPFETKGKDHESVRLIKALSVNGSRYLYFHTPQLKKSKVKDGYYSFAANGDEAVLKSFKKSEDIVVEQDERNNFEGGPPPSTDYKYAIALVNGHILSIASNNGTDVQFLHFSSRGELLKKSTAYMLNDIASQENVLHFEMLETQKPLISSRVGYNGGVYTSYGTYNVESGYFKTIQPKKDIASINTYRNGDDIIVYGTSWEDEKKIHLIHYKVKRRQNSLTSLEQD